MTKLARWGIGMAVLLVLFAVSSSAGDDKDVPIKEVMKKAHKGEPPLCAKVATGKASKEEKEMLVGLYVALAKNKPPKGEADSWKDKTGALIAAAKACLADEKDGPDKLKKATNCKACHEVHKGK